MNLIKTNSKRLTYFIIWVFYNINYSWKQVNHWLGFDKHQLSRDFPWLKDWKETMAHKYNQHKISDCNGISQPALFKMLCIFFYDSLYLFILKLH